MRLRGHQINLFKATPWLEVFNGLFRWDGTKLRGHNGVSEIIIGPNPYADSMYLIHGTYTGDGTAGRVITPGIPVGGTLQYVAIYPRTTSYGGGADDYKWRTTTMSDVIAAGGIFQYWTGTSWGSTGITSLSATTFTISDAPPEGTNATGELKTYLVLYTIP